MCQRSCFYTNEILVYHFAPWYINFDAPASTPAILFGQILLILCLTLLIELFRIKYLVIDSAFVCVFWKRSNGASWHISPCIKLLHYFNTRKWIFHILYRYMFSINLLWEGIVKETLFQYMVTIRFNWKTDRCAATMLGDSAFLVKSYLVRY